MRHSAGAWSGKTSEVPSFRLKVQRESATRFERGFRAAVSASTLYRPIFQVTFS